MRSLEPFEDSVHDLGNLPRVCAGAIDIKHPPLKSHHMMLRQRIGGAWLRVTGWVRTVLDGLDACAGKWLGVDRALK